MSRTTNYQLYEHDDCTVEFLEWIDRIAGSGILLDGTKSNMSILDDVINQLKIRIETLEASGGGSVPGSGTVIGTSHTHEIDDINNLWDELNKRLIIKDPNNILGGPPYEMNIESLISNSGSEGSSSGISKHNDLAGRFEENCHKIESIIGLKERLDALEKNAGGSSPGSNTGSNPGSGTSCEHYETDQLDFSDWNSGIMREKLSTGETVNYEIAFDDDGRPVTITQQDTRHVLRVVW